MKEAWAANYTSVVRDAYGTGLKVATDSSGDVFVLGQRNRNNMLLLKYAGANGQTIWTQQFDATNSVFDTPVDLVLDLNGDVLVTGYYSNTFGDDFYTVKYSGETGEVIWMSRYSGSNQNFCCMTDRPTAVAVDAAGSVFVTGSTTQFGANLRYAYTAKYAAPDGTLLWEQRTGQGGEGLIIDSKGNPIGIGSYDRADGSTDYYTAKYSGTNGIILWEQSSHRVIFHFDYPRAVTIDSLDNIIVTGDSYNGTNNAFYSVKYSGTTGALLWEQRSAVSVNQRGFPSSIRVDAHDDVVVTGTIWTNGQPVDFYTAKYSGTNGSNIWEQFYDGPARGGDWRVTLALDSQGNAIITGSSYGNGTTNDYQTIKYSATDGAIMWQRRYDGPTHGNDQPYGICVDEIGDVLVTGVSGGDTTGEDFYTAKYKGADGLLLWEKRYDAPTTGITYPAALALDSTQDLIVTATSYKGPGAATDFYTAKYESLGGRLLWEQHYNGAANSSDTANALALDFGGNVIVAGSSFYGTNTELYIVKYAGTNGLPLWDQRYDGPGSRDEPHSVAVDSKGDIVVTGYSIGTNNSSDVYTAKFNGRDGALLWEKRMPGPNESSGPLRHMVALDKDDNVFVTSGSRGNGGKNHFTIKHAGTNGAIMWLFSHTNSNTARLAPNAMRVDAAGNVIVAGTLQHDSGYSDYYSVKINGRFGFPVWTRQYSAGDLDNLKALTIDSQNNPFITGYSRVSTNSFYYTAKYSGTNGSLLWEKTYNGPAAWYESRAIALDPAENVIVSGEMDGGSLTIKYSGKDGTTLWEQISPGLTVWNPTCLGVAKGGGFTITGFSGDSLSTVRYSPENRTPVAGASPATTNVAGTALHFQIPTDSFQDPNSGQLLSFLALDLPHGVAFDNANLSFTGRLDAVGTFSSRLVATDDGIPPLSVTNQLIFVSTAPPPPTIVTAPVTSAATIGGNAFFSVQASSIGHVLYQWQLNGADLPGATNSTLILTNIQRDHAGAYTVVISNLGGSVVSSPAVLTATQVEVSEGLANIRIFGPLNGHYSLEASFLLPPAGLWVNLTNIVLQSGAGVYTDPESSHSPQRFYRAIPNPSP